MSNLESSYTKILSVLQQLNNESNFLNQIRVPKLSDIELIALSLTAEYLNIDSERALFRRLPQALLQLIDRTVYHRRKKRLFVYIESLRVQMVDQFMIRRNYAKSFQGFATRILTKIIALTVIQMINHLEKRNINNLKIKIA